MNSTAQVHQNQLGSKYKLATLTTLLLVFLVVVGLRPAAGQSTDPSVVGQWTVPQDWSFEAVHMHLLPTGKVLFWPGFDLGDNPKIWDPATNTVTTAAFAGFNIFCSGHVFLANGQLFVGGGHNNASNYGLANASLYDPISDSWRSLPTMNAGRWYPTATTLANGDVLITSGEIDPNTGNNPLPQVYQAGPGTCANGAERPGIPCGSPAGDPLLGHERYGHLDHRRQSQFLVSRLRPGSDVRCWQGSLRWRRRPADQHCGDH